MNHPTTEEQLDTLRKRLNSPSTPQKAKEAIEKPSRLSPIDRASGEKPWI